jgi:hypothetical protein
LHRTRNGFDQGDLGRRRFILDSSKIFLRAKATAPAAANRLVQRAFFCKNQE